MSKRLHHFTLLLVYSLFASFQRNSDEEEGSPLSFTSPAHPTRTPDHLTKRLLNLEKTFSALTHASFLFCFVFLNQSGGCAQSGCSCLRDPSRNIWTPSTLVFLPLRTALMRRFLGSFPRTGHSARMHFLSVKITTKKKRAFSGLSKDFIISSSSYRLTLMFVFPVLIHFCSVSLGRGILSTG